MSLDSDGFCKEWRVLHAGMADNVLQTHLKQLEFIRYQNFGRGLVRFRLGLG